MSPKLESSRTSVVGSGTAWGVYVHRMVASFALAPPPQTWPTLLQIALPTPPPSSLKSNDADEPPSVTSRNRSRKLNVRSDGVLGSAPVHSIEKRSASLNVTELPNTVALRFSWTPLEPE